MAKITWLGEDEVTRDERGEIIGESPGPSFTTWQNMKFPKGVPVEVTDLPIITRARGNRYFKVEGGPGRPPGSTAKKNDDDAED